jgi:hypothetical protein
MEKAYEVAGVARSVTSSPMGPDNDGFGVRLVAWASGKQRLKKDLRRNFVFLLKSLSVDGA